MQTEEERLALYARIFNTDWGVKNPIFLWRTPVPEKMTTEEVVEEADLLRRLKDLVLDEPSSEDDEADELPPGLELPPGFTDRPFKAIQFGSVGRKDDSAADSDKPPPAPVEQAEAEEATAPKKEEEAAPADVPARRCRRRRSSNRPHTGSGGNPQNRGGSNSAGQTRQVWRPKKKLK